MKFKETIGIDVSKKTLDVHLHLAGVHRQYDNQSQDIKEMIQWVFTHVAFSGEQTLFVFEHTGLYSHLLGEVLSESGLPFAVVSGLQIKRSMGLVRGKSDPIDAAMIARYAYRLREEITPTVLSSVELQSVKRLLVLRDRLVRQRAGFKASLKEHASILKAQEQPLFFEVHARQIDSLSADIANIEHEIQAIIASHAELGRLFELLVSINGIGKVTAWFMIALTAGFTKFDTWRQFACYSGVAPFPHTSGASLRGRTRVSHLANKRIKSLLDQCAKSAIQHNTELRQYYERRLELGKNKMSTLNSVRNKLLARMFAVVKRNTPYVDTKKYAA